MITLQHLSQHLNQLLSCDQFEDAPSGIQVEGKEQIKRVGFAVSANLRAIEEAIEKKCDALIVHHGLFWPKDSLIVTGSKKEKLKSLLGAETSLLAYHLPLDAHPRYGNNWKAAHDLQWRELKPFGVYGRSAIGVKGIMNPTSSADFQKKLEKYYGHVAHAALASKKMISSAALVSGGAHKMIEQAASEGLDCFITGSFDEPIWDIARERDIHFFALGHYATERIGVLALKDYVEKEFSIRTEWIETPNPF